MLVVYDEHTKRQELLENVKNGPTPLHPTPLHYTPPYTNRLGTPLHSTPPTPPSRPPHYTPFHGIQRFPGPSISWKASVEGDAQVIRHAARHPSLPPSSALTANLKNV